MRELLKNHYMVIKNFISEEHAKHLSTVFYDKNRKDGNPCGQVEGSIGFYKPIESLEVLTYECPKLCRILGENLLPTYSYVRLYKSGNILEKHTDRASCEISVTVHLDGDEEWLFGCFDKQLSLNPGDAILYLGHLVPHYRVDPYKGKEYLQFFMHYVRTRGCHKEVYFDKRDMEVNEKKLMEELYGI